MPLYTLVASLTKNGVVRITFCSRGATKEGRHAGPLKEQFIFLSLLWPAIDLRLQFSVPDGIPLPLVFSGDIAG